MAKQKTKTVNNKPKNIIMENFEESLRTLINRFSLENESDTPDFILAKYINECLIAYNKAVQARDKWFGVDMWAHDKIKVVKQ